MLSIRPSTSAAWFDPVRCCVSSVAVVPLRVTPICTRSLSATAPSRNEASIPGPEKLRTTSIAGTLVNVKLPPASTALEMLVPPTVIVTPDVLRMCQPDRAGLDTPETVPTMVAPPLAGVGATVAVGDEAPLGAVGDPWLPQATHAGRRAMTRRSLNLSIFIFMLFLNRCVGTQRCSTEQHECR